MNTFKSSILLLLLFSFLNVEKVISSDLPKTTNNELESLDGFKMRAYPIGRMGNPGIDIIVKLQSLGEKTLVTVRFAFEGNKGDEYLATKNSKYKIIDPNASKNGIKLSDYNYVFTSNSGEVYGFLLEI